MRPGHLLIDSNLLVLLVVGSANPDYIRNHKRLKSDYTEDDYPILISLINEFPAVILTPYTLTETYNLAKDMREPARKRILATMALLIEKCHEHYVPALTASKHANYYELGLIDAMLLEMLNSKVNGQMPVLLTVDLDLAIAAEMAGFAVINFNHHRDV